MARPFGYADDRQPTYEELKAALDTMEAARAKSDADLANAERELARHRSRERFRSAERSRIRPTGPYAWMAR